MQYELTFRQKDCIGEYVPIDRPGISDVTWKGKKWIRGVRWEEIDSNMILRHQMSKARKVKILEFDLKLYPMIMAEFGLMLGILPTKVTRDLLPATGPMIVSEETKRPWRASAFSENWRKIATAIGIPKSVKNMDSRAGGTTETIEVFNGNLEPARKQAGHSDARTTQRYSRGLLKSNSDAANLRSKL